MTADFQGYLAARDLLSRVAPFLIWPSVAAAWAGVFLPLLRTKEKKGDSGAFWSVAAVSLLLTGCFLLLLWYHWKIFRSLPLELPDRVGAWINQQLAARGGGSLGPVDWSRPPRFAIPFWIEGEKFFFWTFILSLVALLEERRRHSGYRMTLRVLLAVQVTGMAFYSNPLLEPLPKFHREISVWFGGEVMEQVRYFFQIYPRMKYYYNASYMWIHPPMLFVAYATLTATFAASLFTLRRSDPVLDRSAYGYAKIGYILLTVGMLVGYPWAIIAWGPNWWWDPKIASSFMMWLLYTGYLHQRFLAHHRHGGWTISALGILCYLSLVFTYFMSWYFPGEHTF